MHNSCPGRDKNCGRPGNGREAVGKRIFREVEKIRGIFDVNEMQEAGVVVEACVNCAEAYGITETIKALGIEVVPMGVPLARFLK